MLWQGNDEAGSEAVRVAAGEDLLVEGFLVKTLPVDR